MICLSCGEKYQRIDSLTPSGVSHWRKRCKCLRPGLARKKPMRKAYGVKSLIRDEVRR